MAGAGAGAAHIENILRASKSTTATTTKTRNKHLPVIQLFFSPAFFSICNFLRPITPMPMAMADAAGAGGAAVAVVAGVAASAAAAEL